MKGTDSEDSTSGEIDFYEGLLKVHPLKLLKGTDSEDGTSGEIKCNEGLLSVHQSVDFTWHVFGLRLCYADYCLWLGRLHESQQGIGKKITPMPCLSIRIIII